MGNIISVTPFNYISIIDCYFKDKVNQHSTGYIKGYIKKEDEEKYLKMSVTALRVDVASKGNTVFFGIVDKIETTTENDVTIMELFLVSYSSLLDIKKETFTFQNAQQTYKELINQIINNEEYSEYEPACLFTKTDKSLEKLIVQYKETDWEFLKRLASHFSTVLVPATRKKGVNFYFGEKQGSNSLANPYAYRSKKNIADYHYKSQNQVEGIEEKHELYFEIDEYVIRDIGDLVKFKNNDLVVYELERKYIQSELVNTYYIKPKEGFQVPKYNNENITGSSLDAKVIDVAGDTVKAHVLVDNIQNLEVAKWFAYSTIYSSPDGSGWYAMPEIGDSIRLYFPTAKEHHGYIMNSTHVNERAPSQRADPDDKLLMNKYGKFVLLKPNGVFISNGDGLHIELIDESGISIKSDKKIDITATASINIESKTKSVNILGKEGVYLRQEQGEIEIKDNISFKGLTGIFN